MVVVGIVGHRMGGRPALLRALMTFGCIASAGSLLLLAGAGGIADTIGIAPIVAALGFSNGAFAVAAIGSMMGLAGSGPVATRGTRMGLWGAAQAVAFGFGGLAGTVTVDVARVLTGQPVLAYQITFAAEGVLFLLSAGLAIGLGGRLAAPVLGSPAARTPR
jgi:BCD family chlorophyll transporter-like MFS transporter